MTAEEKKKADEAKKLAEEKAIESEIAKEEKELAEKEAAKKKADDEAKKLAEDKAVPGTFIMKVSHLSWGANGRSHFYNDKKPLISAKVMGKYSGTLDIWIKNGWVTKGSYK